MTAAVAALVTRDAVLEAQDQVERAQRELQAVMALMAAAGRRSQLPADATYPLLYHVELHLQVAMDQLSVASAG